MKLVYASLVLFLVALFLMLFQYNKLTTGNKWHILRGYSIMVLLFVAAVILEVGLHFTEIVTVWDWYSAIPHLILVGITLLIMVCILGTGIVMHILYDNEGASTMYEMAYEFHQILMWRRLPVISLVLTVMTGTIFLWRAIQ